MSRSFVSALAVAGLIAAAGSARAQIRYEFADNAGNALSSFSVAPGGSIPIRVYLHELTAGAPTFNSQGGLGTGSVRVTFNTPGGVAAVQSASDVTPAVPPWDSPFASVNSTSAVI